jgi:glycosyltransferase involved in cell wall biosynthesis
MKKNIFFFLPNFKQGGAGKSILNLCKFLDKKKYNIYVISLKKNYYKFQLRNYCKKIYEIDNEKTILSFYTILQILKPFSSKDTLFISNINYANVLSVIFIKIFFNYKVILIERTPIQELDIFFSIKDFIKKKLIKILMYYIYKYANCIISNSKKTARDIAYFSKFNSNYIYPLTLEKIKPFIARHYSPKKNFEIVTVSRLSKEKNLEEIIFALKDIKNYKVNLKILGNGELKKNLNNIIKKYKVRAKIISYNKKNNEKYLKTSHLYICSSHFEGFPNAVVEAINYNLPVLSSQNYGGIDEILLYGEGGDFYDQKIFGDLTTSINNIINNYTEAVKKNKIAKKNLLRFTFNNIKKFEFWFDKVLSN